MKLKDKTMKEFLENNAYFVDFFNAYFFNGEKVLKPENCEELDSEMNDANMDLEKHVDVIRKYNDGNLYSAFIIENQSRVDYSMVVRAATYEFVAYERMLKKSKKNRKDEKLPMVHILVFYTGERPWNAARQLSELVEVDERFKSYFHEYKMNLIEITGNTSYNFNEEDVYNLFYICRSIILIGYGKIGKALVNYRGFENESMKIVAAFDHNPEKIDREAKTPILPIEELKDYIINNKIEVAILTVPDLEAQRMFDVICNAGIKGVLNFAPIKLLDKPNCIINDVNIVDEIESLFYFINDIENTTIQRGRIKKQ